jgi:Glycosyltransferase family 9 (heptosyltransferase)
VRRQGRGARQPQLQFLSVQKGPGAEQLVSCPFLDTAAIISACDLIICSDSMVAHLAGALGRPVWLLLKWMPDWRWGLKSESRHWYPLDALVPAAALRQWR